MFHYFGLIRRSFVLIVTTGVVGFMLLQAALGQEPGPNRNVVTGVVDPSEPNAPIKTDIYLQRQNEAVAAVSTVNPHHLLVAANDYRTIDIAGDEGLGEYNESFIAELIVKLFGRTSFLARLLGLSEPKTPKAAAEAWMGIYRSTDRGATWVGSLLPGSPTDTSPASLASPLRGLEAASDPSLASGPDGFVHVGGLAFTRGGSSAIFAARYVDRNNREGGAGFRYELTRVVDVGSAARTGRFADIGR